MVAAGYSETLVRLRELTALHPSTKHSLSDYKTAAL
jgi:hypothetical protein